MMSPFLLIFALISADTLVISIEDAVRMALEANPSLKSAEAQTASSKLNFYETALSGIVTPTLTYTKEDTFASTTSLGLDLTLFDINRVASATSSWGSARSQVYQLRETRNSTVLSTQVSYLSLLAAQADVEAKRRSLERAEANLRLIEKKFELGAATKLDLMRAKVQRGQAELALITAENTLANARAQLAVLLGLDPSIVVVAKDFDFTPDTAELDLDSLIAAALSHRPKVLAQQIDTRTAKASFWMSALSVLPRVSMSWNWMRQNGHDWTREGPTKRTTLTLDLIGYPFRVATARQTARSAEYALKSVRIEVAKDVQAKYLELMAARRKFELAQATLEQARMAYELASAQYEAGELSVIELFDAESDLADAEAQFEAAKYDVYKAILNLKFAVGEDL